MGPSDRLKYIFTNWKIISPTSCIIRPPAPARDFPFLPFFRFQFSNPHTGHDPLRTPWTPNFISRNVKKRFDHSDTSYKHWFFCLFLRPWQGSPTVTTHYFAFLRILATFCPWPLSLLWAFKGQRHLFVNIKGHGQRHKQIQILSSHRHKTKQRRFGLHPIILKWKNILT